MKTIKTLIGTLLIAFFAAVPVFLSPLSASAHPGVVAQLNFDADCSVGPGVELTTENCGIIAYLVLAINLLSAAAGLAIVASIMIAGYQYMTARDNSGQIEAARKRIVWALMALVLFVFTYAFLNFIVPGGVL